ncbi:hypothetical protein Aperf_G00000127624 [Anoplocephala perfoliata]
MLFGNIGVIEELVIYPSEGDDCPSKVCYIRYADTVNAEVALHLHNTMFLDRALIILPVVNSNGVIPDEKYADLVRAPLNTSAGIHPRSASWPLDVISMVVGRPGEQVIQTIDPRLASMGFPVYPPLPAATDCNRIEEIRRTVLVTNLDPKVTGEQVLEFFNAHAEVKCVRMAGSESERAAYVEFTEQTSILKAFGLMGSTLGDRQIMVQHSNCAIIKPTSSLPGLEDSAKRATPRSSNISTTSRLRSRSRSKSRVRLSPSRSKRRRSRSRRGRSKSRSPGLSRSHTRGRRRASRERSSSRSHRSRRIRSPSVHHRDRRSRSRDRRRRSRDRRERERRDRHERERVRRDRRSRSRHKRSRSPRSDHASLRGSASVHREKRHSSRNGSPDHKETKERSASHATNSEKSVAANGLSVMKPKQSDPDTKDPNLLSMAKNSIDVGTGDSGHVKKPLGVKLAGPEEEDIEG